VREQDGSRMSKGKEKQKRKGERTVFDVAEVFVVPPVNAQVRRREREGALDHLEHNVLCQSCCLLPHTSPTQMGRPKQG
jgi:hypothetical protein